MREHKFRGKDIKTGKWKVGSFINDFPTPVIVTFYNDSNIIDYHVIPETVGEYTGLRDKSGTEIFEGDIITWVDSDDIVRTDIVVWIRGGLCLCNANYTVGSYLHRNLSVVGNIHDNPELLKEGKTRRR